jgi:hypothetical protein
MVIDKMPVLGTGKTDYPALTELVKQRAQKKPGLAA